MNKILTEKYEVHAPNPSDKDPGPWMSDASARTRKNRQTRDDGMKFESYRAGLNCLPPGANIEDQEVADISAMELASPPYKHDAQGGPSGGDFVKGYEKLPLKPTDDQYTREHNDAFYDSVTVDGETGYLERNNYLDRS